MNSIIINTLKNYLLKQKKKQQKNFPSLLMQQTPIKIVLLGPSGCGKSSILNKFCFDFGRVKSTIGCDHILMNIILKNKQYLVSVWDVSGLELQSPTMKIFLRDALGFEILFFSLGIIIFFVLQEYLWCVTSQTSSPNQISLNTMRRL